MEKGVTLSRKMPQKSMFVTKKTHMVTLLAFLKDTTASVLESNLQFWKGER